MRSHRLHEAREPSAQGAQGREDGEDGAYPPFAPRFPWLGGDLPTLRNFLLRPRVDLSAFNSRRVYLPMADGSGDRLAATLEGFRDDGPRPASPLVVLIHGLTGCEDSVYMRTGAAFHLARGRRVLRLNMRGAGPSRPTCGGHYHAVLGADIRDALHALESEAGAESTDITRNGLFLVGYSLGGNILVNFLADYGRDFPVLGAATVSAPIEPARSAVRLMARRNTVYHRRLLKQMKQEAMGEGARLTDREHAAITASRSIYEFDRDFIGPSNGYSGADDYYADTAGARRAPEISTPTLLIHARDDPWIPANSYDTLARRGLSGIRIVIADRGGHVGFHGRGWREPWHERCIDAFMRSLEHGAAI